MINYISKNIENKSLCFLVKFLIDEISDSLKSTASSKVFLDNLNNVL